MIVLVVGALVVSQAALVAPSVTLTHVGDSSDCRAVFECDALQSEVTEAGDVGWVTIGLGGDGQFTNAEFGLRFSPGLGVDWFLGCLGGVSIVWPPVTIGVSYDESVFVSGVLRPLISLGIAASTTGTIEVVDHPTTGRAVVTTLEGGEEVIPLNHRGVFGIGVPGWLPCRDAVPVSEVSWTSLKCRFDPR